MRQKGRVSEGQGGAGQFQALVEVEQMAAALGGVVGDADDDPVEDGAGAGDDVDVPEGDRVEGSGVHGERHGSHASGRAAPRRDARRGPVRSSCDDADPAARPRAPPTRKPTTPRRPESAPPVRDTTPHFACIRGA